MVLLRSSATSPELQLQPRLSEPNVSKHAVPLSPENPVEKLLTNLACTVLCSRLSKTKSEWVSRNVQLVANFLLFETPQFSLNEFLKNGLLQIRLLDL